MRCLSVRQPWAWAICSREKRIENRTWSTNFRGTIAIHAGSSKVGINELRRRVKSDKLDESAFPLGAVVGIADIVDCLPLNEQLEENPCAPNLLLPSLSLVRYRGGIMRPGEVTTDDQAFRQILKRLQDEPGAILKLVEQSKAEGGFPNTAPFWALVRMLFPIAESLGDLIYRESSTVKNLTSVLGTEFEMVRPGYKHMANTLAVLYRHSLTHQDEMRALQTGGKEVVWIISYGASANHLEFKQCPIGITLHFDTSGFHEDIETVCRTAISKPWGGLVKDRYNGWLALNLDARADKYKDTIAEIRILLRDAE